MRRSAILTCALAALPGPALAADWDVRMTGYATVGIGYADPILGDEGVGVARDGEVHFRARFFADNGLVFESRVEIEAFSALVDQIDENWVSVSGAFGSLVVGGADTALNEHGGVGVLYPAGSFLNYYDGDLIVIPGDPGSMVGKNDSIGIRYWRAFGGFEAGVSYQPTILADNVLDTNNFSFKATDQFAVGAHYAGEVGGFGFVVGGGWLVNDVNQTWHAGVEASYAGVSVAAFYDRFDPDGASVLDLERIGLGAMYETGPWSLGGGYTHTNGMNGTRNQNFVHVGGAYDVAPGVTASAAVQWGEGALGQDGAGVFSWLNVRF